MSRKIVILLIIAAISVPSLIALGTITLWPVQGEEESNAQAADRNSIKIIEVETVDRSKSKWYIDNAPGVTVSAEEEEYEEETLPPLQSIEQIKELASVVYAPTYVPPGFEFLGARIIPDINLILTVYSTELLELYMYQRSYPSRVRAKGGHVREITAKLVRGGRVQVEKDGEVSPTMWDPDLGSTLYFEIDGYAFELKALPNHPEADFDEAELVKIAESLHPVK